MAEPAALVTGAASGIGAATVRRLAADGVRRFALVDLNPGPLEATGAELREGGADVLTFAHDVADPEAWGETEAAIRERFGTISAVVANAGITDSGEIAQMPFAAWRRVLSVNLDGVFLTLQASLRLLEDGGAAVVVASAAAIKAGNPGIAAYGASKAGAVHLAKVAALEAAPRRIRVNAILPGGVQTAIWEALPFWQELLAEAGGDRAAAFDKLAGFATPLGRYARPEETAAQIAFLLSDAAATMTGATLVADGGYSL